MCHVASKKLNLVFAVELLRLKVDDVIAAVAPSSVWAAKAATKDPPIVALDLESDPFPNGFVNSWHTRAKILPAYSWICPD
jgi:hypothetical protein